MLEQAAAAHGGVGLVVNAASAYGGDRSGPFGGGPISDAAPDAFDAWAAAPARSAFSFLSAAGAFLLAQGSAATVIQVTGGSSRRAAAGRGLWAAGAFGVRAITQAAALELREHGIHVALLIVDAGIQPLDDAAAPSAGRRRPARARGRGALPRRAGRPRRHARAAGHPARGALGAVARFEPLRAATARPAAAAGSARDVLGADDRGEHGDEQRRDDERRDDDAEQPDQRRRRPRRRAASG